MTEYKMNSLNPLYSQAVEYKDLTQKKKLLEEELDKLSKDF